MRQIGINMHAVRGLSGEDYAKKVKSLGFDTVFTGVAKTIESQCEYADIFARNGLVYENLHAPFGHINDIWLDTDGGEKMLEELMFSVDACHAAGAPILVVHLSSGLKPPSITDIGRARFEALVEHATKNGVTLAFENQRKLANIAWVFEHFEDCDNVGFCWDCGHEACFTLGREYMPLFGKKLVCTHIHDNTAIFNADLHMLPFDGVIDFDRFAKHIKDSGYKGPLTLEVMAGHSNFYEGVSIDDYLQKAADVIKKLRTMVDGE